MSNGMNPWMGKWGDNNPKNNEYTGMVERSHFLESTSSLKKRWHKRPPSFPWTGPNRDASQQYTPDEIEWLQEQGNLEHADNWQEKVYGTDEIIEGEVVPVFNQNRFLTYETY